MTHKWYIPTISLSRKFHWDVEYGRSKTSIRSDTIMESLAVSNSLDRESRSIGLYLLLPIGTIIVLAFLSLFCLKDIRECEYTSVEYYKASAAINSILRDLLNAETGQRGYILTQDTDYLEPYYATVSQIPGHFEDLYNSISSQEVLKSIDEVRSLSTAKLEQLDSNIQLVHNGNADSAKSRMKDNSSRNTMDGIRELVRKVDSEYRRELHLQVGKSWQSTFNAIALGSIAFLVGLCTIVVSFVRAGRELALRNRSDQLQQQRTIQLQSFADIASRIVTCPDVDSIVGIAMNEFRILIGTREAMLRFKTGDTLRVEHGATALGTHQVKSDYLNFVFELIDNLSQGESTFFRHRPEIVKLANAASNHSWQKYVEHIDSILTAPILNLQREEIGRFALLNKLNGNFNTNDLSIVAQLAFILSAAIENTRLTELASQAAVRKDEFLAMLGHELRNPLAGVLTGSEALLTESPELSVQESKLVRESIHRQACMMQYLIDDLLDVSRIGQGKVSLIRMDCNITAVARHAIRDHQELHPERALTLDGGDETASVVVFGDQTRLSQCITNLLNNACKFSSAEEPIVVKLRHAWSNELSCDAVSIQVTDQGIGLNEDELRSIFELFYQANDTIDRSQGGLGIGLTLAKGLVEMHGGSLIAASLGRNQGSSFTIQLPVKSLVEPQDFETSSLNVVVPEFNRANSKPISILAIDDRADALLPIRVLMTRDGHQVAESRDGLEGIKMAKALLPDLILCDIGLPGLMNGYDVAQAIRADSRLKNTYLVALSGYSQPSDRKRAQAAGFDFHVAKPIKLSMLRNLVSNRPRF